jgi:hypothetical protein
MDKARMAFAIASKGMVCASLLVFRLSVVSPEAGMIAILKHLKGAVSAGSSLPRRTMAVWNL